MSSSIRHHGVDLLVKETLPAHEAGPIATTVGVVFTFFAPVFVLGAYPMRPNIVTLLALLPLGAMLLLPRGRLLSMRLSLPLVAYVAWSIASLAWAVSFGTTLAFIRVFTLSTVSITLVAAYLPRELFMKTWLRSMQFIIVLTVFAVVSSPSGRSVANLAGVDLSGGWRGYFAHKNLMSPVVVLATITNLAFEKDRRVAAFIVASAAALMLGAQSVTGLAAFIVGVLVWYWTGLISRGGVRERSITRVATSLVGIIGLGLVLNFVGALLDAFGKDLTFSGRTDIWELTWPLIEQQPLQGYGLGGPYSDLSNQVSLQFFLQLRFYIQHAHNGLVDLLATLGLVGVVIVTVLVVGTFRAAGRVIGRDQLLGRWVIASLVAMIFMGFSENLFSPQYIFVIAAMRIGLMSEAANSSATSSFRDVSTPLARDL